MQKFLATHLRGSWKRVELEGERGKKKIEQKAKKFLPSGLGSTTKRGHKINVGPRTVLRDALGEGGDQHFRTEGTGYLCYLPVHTGGLQAVFVFRISKRC